MIETALIDGVKQITLSPNKSMSWETNKKILMVMFAVNMTIAGGWVYMGAWPVLPFAGLEVALVGVGMYYASWKLNFKEVIRVHEKELVLQKGVYFPKQEWSINMNQARVLKIPSKYRMSPAKFFLVCNEVKVEIGSFLNLKEKKQLALELSELNLPISTSRK